MADTVVDTAMQDYVVNDTLLGNAQAEEISEQLRTISHQMQLLTEQVAYLTAHARELERQRARMESIEESVSDFLQDAWPLTSEMMNATVSELSVLEEKGYVAFVRQLFYIMDRVVTSFTEEDVRQLGDNIVLILSTVKSMTQPEIMTLLGNVGMNLREAEQHVAELPTSTLGLLRRMGDPDVRRGLAVAIAMLKATGTELGPGTDAN